MLASRWRLILVTTIGFAAVGLAVSLLILFNAPLYESQALVLVSKPRYQVELETKIKSTQDPVASTAVSMAALNARLITISTLAVAPEVEAAVQKRLADRLPADDLQSGALIGRIRVRPNNEMLRVTATAPNPQQAAELANAWAEEMTNRVETIYSASAGSEAIETEVAKARQAHEAADQAYSQFLIANPVEDLNRRVTGKNNEITLLQDQRTSYLRARAALLYSTLVGIEQTIRDTETFRKQLEEPSQSQAAAAGDALAMVMLRARGYLPQNLPFMLPESVSAPSAPSPTGTASGETPRAPVPSALVSSGGGSNLQLSPSALAFPVDQNLDRLHDVDALSQALRTRAAEIQTEFDALATRLRTGRFPEGFSGTLDDAAVEAALSQSLAELQTMRAELADMARKRDELASQRSTLLTTYQSLYNKAQELRVLKATTGGEGISVAERAVVRRSPVWPRPVMFIGVAGLLGLLLGCVLALSPALRGWLHEFARLDRDGQPVVEPPAPRAALSQPR
jgi:uncharacterized protein involved in exopolysaccharide biosynthesis